ncbi:MAG: GNAT family N-acetyltransferase [Paracoccaceae bacterium]
MTETMAAGDGPEISERIERRALEALHEVATPEIRARLGLSLTALGDGVVSMGTRLPTDAIDINRTLGLGTAGPLDPAWLGEAVARYRAAGVPEFVIHLLTEDPAPFAEAIAEAGLVRTRRWQKFVRGPEAPLPETEDGLALAEVDPEDGTAAGLFGEIAARGFDLGAEAADWLARLPQHPDWTAWLVIKDGRPAGTGALFSDGVEAWTDWAVTHPEMRRQGVQRFCLAERVRIAHARGVERVFTCTGEAVEGDPQHSYRNMLRCGFRTAELRETLSPAGAASRAQPAVDD